jgi:hypothetical protein
LIKVANWDKWQTFRKDRGTPNWIKVHRNLFSNPEWAVLTDSEKGQLLSVWILAADKNGTIPADPRIIQKMCLLDDLPNLSKFIDLGFLQSSGDKVVTAGLPDGAKVAAQSREEESREEESREEESREEEIVISSPSRIKYSDSFKSFWDNYPNHRRGNKKNAYKQWKLVDPDLYNLITDQVLLRGSADAKWQEKGGDYIVHAERFLSGSRWEDNWMRVSQFSSTTQENITRLADIGDLNG